MFWKTGLIRPETSGVFVYDLKIKKEYVRALVKHVSYSKLKGKIFLSLFSIALNKLHLRPNRFQDQIFILQE